MRDADEEVSIWAESQTIHKPGVSLLHILNNSLNILI